jgi:DNA-binding GntR family transcriptional regulator
MGSSGSCGPGRRGVICRVSVSEAVEITEARAALESLVARRAAERADEADRRELRDLIDQMTEAVEGDDRAGYSKLNRTLHAALPRIARHGVAADLIDNLRNRAVESLAQHGAIVDAVVGGDGPAAERAMQAHLASVIDSLRQWEGLD